MHDTMSQRPCLSCLRFILHLTSTSSRSESVAKPRRPAEACGTRSHRRPHPRPVWSTIVAVCGARYGSTRRTGAGLAAPRAPAARLTRPTLTTATTRSWPSCPALRYDNNTRYPTSDGTRDREAGQAVSQRPNYAFIYLYFYFAD